MSESVTDPNPTVESALEFLKSGDMAQAGVICNQVLDQEPDNAKAWHLLGIVHAQQNELARAAECFEKAIENRGDVASYHYNLGLAYQGLKDFEGALKAYRGAVAIKPEFVEAQKNLGNCLIDSGEQTEAVDHFQKLGEQFPDESIVHYNLGNVLEEAGEIPDAIVAFRRAIEIDPDFATARENLGRALSDVELFDQAIEVWQEWLNHDPDNAVAKHMLSAIQGEQTPDRCDDDYIRDTFDHDFARSYEKQLERIEYRVPELIADAIDSLEIDRRDLTVLDAGCGTGLCAKVLKPLAERLVGVDLSADMLAEAEKLDIYDTLLECELTEYLIANPEAYDLIVSGDTLCYFGQLRDVLAGISGCLTPGGRVVFTVARLDSDDENEADGFQLQPNGRYQHYESYVRQALTDAGLQLIELRNGTLRMERGREVTGMVVVADR